MAIYSINQFILSTIKSHITIHSGPRCTTGYDATDAISHLGFHDDGFHLSSSTSDDIGRGRDQLVVIPYETLFLICYEAGKALAAKDEPDALAA